MLHANHPRELNAEERVLAIALRKLTGIRASDVDQNRTRPRPVTCPPKAPAEFSTDISEMDAGGAMLRNGNYAGRTRWSCCDAAVLRLAGPWSVRDASTKTRDASRSARPRRTARAAQGRS